MFHVSFIEEEKITEGEFDSEWKLSRISTTDLFIWAFCKDEFNKKLEMAL
jgi:hypothetical protein